MTVFILFAMLFLHTLDDFHLQGALVNLKQRKYWLKNSPSDLFKYDYLVALFVHSFSWTFMTMLPIVIYYRSTLDSIIIKYVVIFIINVMCHAFIDNLRANKYKINLVTEQLLHVAQILLTYFIFM